LQELKKMEENNCRTFFPGHLGALFLLMGVTVASCILLMGCRESGIASKSVAHSVTTTAKQSLPLRIGYDGSPLLAPLYSAYGREASAKPTQPWELVRFDSGGDIGYSLLAGKINAGFVETAKALRLLKAPGGEKLKVAGAIQFPYGATLVIRKGLNIRLTDLPGLTIAASEPDCVLLHQFRKDAGRHGVAVERIRFSYMPFDEMLPALEAGMVDGILVKGSYALLAEHAGHNILYQNWDVKAGDECCPASLAQTDYFLVVREEAVEAIKPFLRELTATSSFPAAELRRAVSRQLGYPAAALEQLPVASFVTIGTELLKDLGERRCVLLR
jgi:ABC-type nitrate/sulfonate/bicarbonate transport system substrate-binding protein